VQAFIDEFQRFAPASFRELRGASVADVARLQAMVDRPLPSDYTEFLLSMGASSPALRWVDAILPLVHQGRRYIDFALETVLRHLQDEDVAAAASLGFPCIGREEGCTGWNAHLDLTDEGAGRVVLAVDPIQEVSAWFEDFRTMLFAAGFYDFQRRGVVVRSFHYLRSIPRTERERPLSRYGPWVEGLRGEPWERAALDAVARQSGLARSDRIPSPSLGYANDTATLLLSNLFDTPIGRESMCLYVSSTSESEARALLGALEPALDVRAIGPFT